MEIIFKDNVIKIIEQYEYNKSTESTIRNMVNIAFGLTRNCHVYSYTMDLYVNDYSILKCKDFNYHHNCISFEDIGVKINVYFDSSVKPGSIELHVNTYDINEFEMTLDKDETKKEKNDMDYEKDLFEYKEKYWKSTINSIYGLPIYNGGFKSQIKKVIFSGPCTIVLWTDNTKTIVRCEGEEFDKEKGLAMAISKKFLGINKNKSDYFDIIKKWCKED